MCEGGQGVSEQDRGKIQLRVPPNFLLAVQMFVIQHTSFPFSDHEDTVLFRGTGLLLCPQVTVPFTFVEGSGSSSDFISYASENKERCLSPSLPAAIIYRLHPIHAHNIHPSIYPCYSTTFLISNRSCTTLAQAFRSQLSYHPVVCDYEAILVALTPEW